MALVGIKALGRLIDNLLTVAMGNADKIVFQHTNETKIDIVENWPVKRPGGGQSRAAWQGPIKVRNGHHRLINNVVYSAVIEYGRYTGVGPKTAQESGTSLPGGVTINPGIYPTQVPYAPVRRALSRRILALENALKKKGIFRGS